MASAASKISWPKNGISSAACALLKAIAAARSPCARGTPARVARYGLRSTLKSEGGTPPAGSPARGGGWIPGPRVLGAGPRRRRRVRGRTEPAVKWAEAAAPERELEPHGFRLIP